MVTNYLQIKCNELTRIIRIKRPDKQQAEQIIKWLNIYCGHIFCDTLIDYGVITKYYLKNEDIQ